MIEASDIFKEHTYIDVEELDLAEFVSKTYGRPWRMQQGEMLGQDTYRIIEVEADRPDGWFLSEAEDQLREWLALPTNELADWEFMREHYLPVDIILWDLCRKGIAPAGEYLIRVWW